MLLCRAARWATLCRQAPKAAAVDAAQRVLWPAHAVPHRSTDMKAPRRCSVECAHGTGTCLRGRKGAPRARCGCTRGACWFFAKAVHSHGYAMASCMRNRTIALFTTRHLAEVPADLGRGIEGAQASTEQQPIVRLSSILGAGSRVIPDTCSLTFNTCMMYDVCRACMCMYVVRVMCDACHVIYRKPVFFY